ncbi:hypothetical protein B0O80DRAFT_459567 [Mortierella sp. GBAus27b]|nr:hypothetical protein B0O80DRAFT_459567 [Mortierella sp. GBAus27b]
MPSSSSSALRVLRILIILMILSGCTDLILDNPASYDIDRFNGYILFVFMVGYLFSLISQYRLVSRHTRAFLMIFLAFIWFSCNMVWLSHGVLIGNPLWRMDVFVAFPTSIMVVVESVLTLKWEAKMKRQDEVLKARQEQEAMVAMSRVGRDHNGSGGGPYYADVLPSRVLPQDEEDHVEVVIPEHLATQAEAGPEVSATQESDHRMMMKRDAMERQRPPQAYRPGSSSSEQSSLVQPAHRHQRQQLHTHMYDNNQLPPYTRE